MVLQPKSPELHVAELTFHIVNMLTILDGTAKDNIPKVREYLDSLEKAWKMVPSIQR